MNKLIHFEHKISENEYMLVELQGSLSHTTEKNFHELFLGRIEKKTEDEYIIFIGNHLLIGKKTNLKNPILVCEKEDGKIKIKKIIKSKIYFNTRPKPIQTSN